MKDLDQIQDDLEGTNILDFLRHDGVALYKHPNQTFFRAKCPFHDAAEGIFDLYVSPKRGTYHCFTCGAGGNALTWVMHTRGVSLEEAADALATEF